MISFAEMLEIEQLSVWFDMNFETGKLYWKQTTSNRVQEGDEAGYPHVGYVYVQYNNKKVAVHRIIFAMYYERWPTDQLDHIDKDRQNNAILNLREVTNQVNSTNRGMTKRNTSGVTGLSLKNNKWLTQIMVNYENKYLGLYVEKWDAICARKAAETKWGFTND